MLRYCGINIVNAVKSDPAYSYHNPLMAYKTAQGLITITKNMQQVVKCPERI